MSPRSNVLMATPEQVDQAQQVITAQPGERATLFSGAPDGARRLPPELTEVFDAVLHALAEGGSITVERMPQMITTTQAARLLGESRPTLMKRIASGELSATMVGTHHRVLTSEVLKLRKRRFAERRAEALEFLALEDELGL